jgi:hypothetical protein
MSERIRKILKEAFQTASAKISLDKNFFGNVVDKKSNLGCLEFKFLGNDEELDEVVAQLKPFLEDLGCHFHSVMKMTNALIITCTTENAESIKNLCKKFNFTLTKEQFSNSTGEANPLKKQNDQTAPNPTNTHKWTDFGRSSSDGRGSAGSAGMIGGQGFPINRLAGESISLIDKHLRLLKD